MDTASPIVIGVAVTAFAFFAMLWSFRDHTMATIVFIIIGFVLAVFVFFVMLWGYRDRNDDSTWWQG